MIRRPPTLIALDEDDIESHLQRICLRHTLTLEFEKLQLDDYESFDLLRDPSPSSSVSSDFDGDSDIDSLNQEGSFCLEDTSPRDEISTSTDVISQPAPVKQCPKSPISNLHRSLQNPISVKSRLADGSRSTDPPRLKVTFALSPQELKLHSGMASFPLEEETVECFGENYPTSHKDTIRTPMSIDSPSPQVSFLSCGVSSSPATAGVPLRDLTLASTMSYEAALAEEAVSPASANSASEGRGSIVI